MRHQTPIPSRFPQPPGTRDVIVEVIDAAVGAVFGALRTVFVGGAFGVGGVVGEVGEGDVGGVAAPDVVDDAGEDVDGPGGLGVCVGDVGGLEEEAAGEEVPGRGRRRDTCQKPKNSLTHSFKLATGIEDLHQIVRPRRIPEHMIIILLDDSRNIILQRHQNYLQRSNLFLLTGRRILEAFPNASDTAQGDSRDETPQGSDILRRLRLDIRKGSCAADTLWHRGQYACEGDDRT